MLGLINRANFSLVNQYRYKPFGQADAASEGVANPLRYAGRELDTETGLYYMRARYYDPGTSRFVSEDPIGLDGGINVYAYAGNNPVTYRDPFGLEGEQEEPDCTDPDSPGGKEIVEGEVCKVKGVTAEVSKGGWVFVPPYFGPAAAVELWTSGGAGPRVRRGINSGLVSVSRAVHGCAAEVGLAGLSVLGDLTFLTGAGLALKAAVGARAAATTFQWMARDAVFREVASTTAVYAHSAQAGYYSRIAVAGYATSLIDTAPVVKGAGRDIRARDLVPVIGSARSIIAAVGCVGSQL